MNKKLS